jgi:hypothetical protein
MRIFGAGVMEICPFRRMLCPTWVKWSEPTAEALRQACLAKDFAGRARAAKPLDHLNECLEFEEYCPAASILWSRRPDCRWRRPA